MVIVITLRLGCWRRNNTSVIWSWLIGASWTCSEIYHFCLSRCFLPRTGQCREINLSFKCNELETAQHNGLLIANEVHIKKRFISQHYLNDSLKLLMILYCVLCDPLKFLAVRTNQVVMFILINSHVFMGTSISCYYYFWQTSLHPGKDIYFIFLLKETFSLKVHI